MASGAAGEVFSAVGRTLIASAFNCTHQTGAEPAWMSAHHWAGVGWGRKVHLDRDLTGRVVGRARPALCYADAGNSQMTASLDCSGEKAMKISADGWIGVNFGGRIL